MKIKESIQAKLAEFITLCKLYNVKSLYAFGSGTTDEDEFDETSGDIDLPIKIDENDPLEKGEKLIAIWNKLEEFSKESL